MINATLNFFINFLTIPFEVLLVDLTNTRPIGNECGVSCGLSLCPNRQLTSQVCAQLAMHIGYANSSISINVGVNL